MRTRLMRGKFTLLFMMLGLLLAVPAIAFAQDSTGTTSPVVPTITSDLPDYPPGATVNLTGSNWQPGESVHINVNDDVGQSWSYDSNPDVIADESGNISHSFTLPNWFVATYKVTATGATSGVATHTFTDKIQTTTSLSRTAGTEPSVSGSSLTFTATVTQKTPSGPATQGIVKFGEGPNCNGSGFTQIGTDQTLTTTNGGVVSVSTSALSMGSHNILACYQGFDTGSGSTSLQESDASLTQTVNPRPPTGLTATANGQNQIDLSWTASDDSANITGYVLKDGANVVSSTIAKNATSFSHTGLAAGSTHNYTLVARYTDTNPNPDVNYDSTAATASATTNPADSTPPTVSSINRKAGSTDPTNNSSVDWTVTFSESVSNVDASDFSLAAGTDLSGTSITSVSGSGTTYTVTANTGTGDGSLGLNLVDDDSIVDGAGNKLKGTGTTGATDGSFTGQTYTIDKTPPTNFEFQFSGTPVLTHDQTYEFGSVPAGPTGCSADGAISGLKSPCSTDAATTYKTTVGTHTITATAEDNAGNVGNAILRYTVDPWEATGFYSPVGTTNSHLQAPGGPVPAVPTSANDETLNTVKGGSTVPLKFEIFAGATELTSTSDVQGFTTNPLSSCATGADQDEVDFTTTGSTILRYDTTAGQFIQNWKTPTVKSDTCYRTVVTFDDGTSIHAFFKVRK